MTSHELTSVDAVVEALGGHKAVAVKTKNVVSAIYNWINAGKFPPNTYILIKGELKHIGRTAPDALWGMRVAERTS